MSLFKRAVPISNFGLASVPWPPSPSQNTVMPALLSQGVVSSFGNDRELRAVVNGAHSSRSEPSPDTFCQIDTAKSGGTSQPPSPPKLLVPQVVAALVRWLIASSL